MEVDKPQEPNGHSSELKVNGLLLHPVSPQAEGEGLPYAPIDWPNPGDIWGWRVGKRTAISGYYLDRYLYLPSRFQKSRKGRDGFASKLSVQQFIQARFPGTDIQAFFASFSWKIPSKQTFLIKEHQSSSYMLSEELAEASLSDCHNSGPACKAGNTVCPSLTEKDKMVSSVTTTMFCDICCGEPSFCRECCCILCCKTIDFTLGGYSFIKCQAKPNDGLICGHSAHLLCALRCYMAGKVPGTIGLDAQYYCRRCDTKTELVDHVNGVFRICESVDSQEDIKKILNLVICLLRGSHKRDAKRLLNRAQLVLQKFESGDISNIWSSEEPLSGIEKDMVGSKYMKNGGIAKVASKASSNTNAPANQEVADPITPSDVIASAPISPALVPTSQGASLDKSQETRTKKREDCEAILSGKKKKARTEDIPTISVSSSFPRSMEGIDTEGTAKFGCRAPSSPDVKQMTIPDGVCVEERKWVDTLPATTAHYEMMHHIEMMRVHLLSSWKYNKHLEMYIEGSQSANLKADLTKAQGEIVLLKGSLTTIRADRDTAVKAKEEALKAKEESEHSKVALQKALEDQTKKCKGLAGKSKEMIAIYEGRLEAAKEQEAKAIEDAINNYRKTEAFKETLGGEIYPHWQQGIRIGIRQAVKKFSSLSPEIAVFEPDYDDDCGEPDLPDSDDEAGLGNDLNVTSPADV